MPPPWSYWVKTTPDTLRRAFAILLVASWISSPGCAADGDPELTATRDTVITHEGAEVTVQVVESRFLPAELSTWHVDSVPALDLGGLGGPEQVVLFRVAGAYRLSDGRVVVADGGSRELKVFDDEGRMTGTIGGPGEGPGEFRQLSHFGLLPGDSLVVWDMGQARLTVFGPDGVRARDLRIGASAESPQSNVTGVFADGSILSRGFIDLGGRVPDGLERHRSELMHLTPVGALGDSIGSILTGETYFRAFEGGFSFHTPPFARTTEVVAAGDRIHVADSERAEIRVLGMDGTPQLLVRWLAPPRAITQTDIDTAWDLALAAVSQHRHADVERMFAEMPMPATMPAFAGLRVDRDGNMWVQGYRTEWDEGMSDWLIFDDAGRLTARAELPAAFTPTDIGSDYVLGIERDALDLEYVRLYPLHR